ncbi:MAG TPA: hypothetical protein EYQ69_04090 [Gemmatimonadetes bacterium]|nr:hypothetical protein [Gemmatimonadota bacterium]
MYFQSFIRIRRSCTLLTFSLLVVSAVALPEKAFSQVGQTDQVKRVFRDLSYRSVGPSRGGRVTAVAGHPAHPFTFYMGATGGGVWKTEDYGNSWRPISDAYFSTGSIGSIRVAPSDPDLVYVGTGSDGIRSNVIVGRGIYRSQDAGETWEMMGLRDMGQLGAVEVDPNNPARVYVAALGNPWAKNSERGVYRSANGGEDWEQVLFTSDSVGAIDLEINPANPDEIYAAMWRGQRQPWTIISGMEASGKENGIWKSSDGGDTWKLVTEGLPTGLIGKIDLSVSAASPNRVYALVETTDPLEGLYHSDDFGETWDLMTNQAGLMNRPFYYTGVTADPTDADKVYVNNEGFYGSSDGGRTFERMPTPHGDNHDLWINPENPNIWIQSNDGGANVSLDGGVTWSTQNNQTTSELYQVDIDDRFPYWLYAGQQDNSTIKVPSDTPEENSASGHTGFWRAVGGCETGPAVPKPGNPDIVYSNCKGRFGRFSQVTGQEKQYYVGFGNLYGANPRDLPYRFQRVAPIEISPHDANVVYHGSQFVHKTTDEGVTWEQISPDLTAFRPERQVVSGEPISRDVTGEEHYSVLYAVEESPVEPGVIWAGSNDGLVQVTRNGGETWKDVTPPGMALEGRIQTIDPSPHKGGKAYFAAYRTLLGDFTPFIYKTDDYGDSWTLLTSGNNGIPDDHPTRAIREDPVVEGLLFAGTEFGMFYSMNDGVSWIPFQLNLPATPITDMKIHNNDLVLSTMGRGFWVLDDISPVRQMDSALATSGPHFFKPSDAIRTRGQGGRGVPGPNEPQWSQQGGVFDYLLHATAQEVELEIRDSEGTVLRTFVSEVSGTRVQTGQGMRAPFERMIGTVGLGRRSGVNRFVWDLQVLGPNGSTRGGPMVVPGTYEAHLTIDGATHVEPFNVVMDPRSEMDGITIEDIQAQYDLGLEVLASIEDADATIDRLTRAMERVSEGGDIEKQLKEIQDALVTDRTITSYPQPMLRDQFQYLYSNSISVDQKPAVDMYDRLDVLKTELEEHKQRLERLMRSVTEESR